MGIVVDSSFKPAGWLKNPHLQTLWPTFFRHTPLPPHRWEVVNTPDGDVLELEFCGSHGPLVIILHGLTGSYRSQYVRGIQWALLDQGWRSMVLNFRGCGRTMNVTSRCYHSGETGDLNFVFRWLRQREPTIPIAAVGYSLGGNVLLKWLGEQGNRIDLFAACAVSVPLQLAKCASRMDQGLSRIYRDRLLSELSQYMNAKIDHLNHLGKKAEALRLKALGDVGRLRSFWEYDDRVIASLYPFQDVHDYYQRCSARAFVDKIEVPTLIVQARDDPFMTPEVIPAATETSSCVTLEISETGGHVGFVESGNHPFSPGYWLDRRIPEFLGQSLETHPTQGN